MKMNKLLAGVAAAALMGGAASAQIEIYQGPTDAPDLSGAPFGTGNLVFASELDLDGVTVPLEFDVGAATGTQWATGANVEGLLEVTFSGGVLDRSLDDDDIEPASGAASCTDALLSVDSDGAAGQNTVTFRIADLQVCDEAQSALNGDENFVFAFPVILDGTDVSVSMTLTRASNGNVIATDTWESSSNNGATDEALIDQASALAFSTATGTATVATGASFTTFSDSTLGAAQVAAAASVLLADGSAVVDGDMDDAALFCTFDNVTGLEQDGHSFGGFANAATDEASNPVTFAATGLAASTSGTLVLSPLTGADAAPIRAQDVFCSGSVSWDTASGLSDTSIPSFFIGRIRREGVQSGLFEWTGDSFAATRSVFRITGLGATAPSASVILTNSTNDMDGEYDITLSTPNNGEVILTNSDIASAVGGAFGRADVQIALHDSALGGAVIRRLLVGTNGTLTDFGNENDDGDSNAPTAPQANDGLGGSN